MGGMPRLPGASWFAATLIAFGTVDALLDVVDCAAVDVLPLAAAWAFALEPVRLLAWAVDVLLLASLLALTGSNAVVSVWLIEINCSKLFTFTN